MIEEAMGVSLRWITRIAGSPLVDRLGLRKPAERLLRTGTQRGFGTVSAAAARMQPLMKLARPARLRPERAAPTLFDLTLTEEQELIQQTMRRFAAEVVAPAARAADDAGLPPAELLEAYHELGVALLAVPEELGGYGQERSPLTSVLVAEELAAGDMGLAYAALAPLGVIHALVDFGTAEQQATYLAPFAGERFLPAALALLEPRPLFDPYRLDTRARRTGDGYRLDGTKSLVALGRSAKLWLVAAALEGGGPEVFVVERGTPGVTVEPEPAMGLRAADLARLRLDGVQLPRGARVGGDDGGLDYAALVDSARVGWAALAVGAGRAVLEHVKTYCNEREQFGEPLSNRQSVAFLVADIAIELDGLRLMTWRAASRAELGKPFQREAYLAKLQAGDKGMQIGTDGVQLLGGHGYVKDHPVELWYRHLRAVGLMEGGLGV